MSSATWTFCQEKSDIILREGLELLRRAQSAPRPAPKAQGNYLISMSDDLFYVGEAKNLNVRLKQQFSPRTSTFYKNYLGLKKTVPTERLAEISTFEARWIQTALGRKEIEEFGIVNLPATLNRFQLGKRALCLAAVISGSALEIP